MSTANMIPRSTQAQRQEVRARLVQRGLHPQFAADEHQPLFDAAGIVCPPSESITWTLQQASQGAVHRLLTTLRERP